MGLSSGLHFLKNGFSQVAQFSSWATVLSITDCSWVPSRPQDLPATCTCGLSVGSPCTTASLRAHIPAPSTGSPMGCSVAVCWFSPWGQKNPFPHLEHLFFLVHCGVCRVVSFATPTLPCSTLRAAAHWGFCYPFFNVTTEVPPAVLMVSALGGSGSVLL